MKRQTDLSVWSPVISEADSPGVLTSVHKEPAVAGSSSRERADGRTEDRKEKPDHADLSRR